MSANDNDDFEARMIAQSRQGLKTAIGEEGSPERQVFFEALADDQEFRRYVRIALIECKLDPYELASAGLMVRGKATISDEIQAWAEGNSSLRPRFRLAFFTQCVLPLLTRKLGD